MNMKRASLIKKKRENIKKIKISASKALKYR